MVRQIVGMKSVSFANNAFQKRERRNCTIKRNLYGMYVTKLMMISKSRQPKILLHYKISRQFDPHK